MEREHTTSAQRLGIFLSITLGLLFAFLATLHWGFEVHLGHATFAAPFLYPAAIVETVLAVALLLAAVLPGEANVRAGRVMLAQILVLICLLVLQVALMRGASLTTWRTEIFYGVGFVLSLGSLVLLAGPAFWREAPKT